MRLFKNLATIVLRICLSELVILHVLCMGRLLHVAHAKGMQIARILLQKFGAFKTCFYELAAGCTNSKP
jgi:hypothetical protein